MDDNYKYVETASDLNVEGKEFYLGEIADESTGLPVYKDKERTQLATAEELIHYYNTNDLILVSGSPDGLSSTKSRVNIIIDHSTNEHYDCTLCYNLIKFNVETQKMELEFNYSIVSPGK